MVDFYTRSKYLKINKYIFAEWSSLISDNQLPLFVYFKVFWVFFMLFKFLMIMFIPVNNFCRSSAITPSLTLQKGRGSPRVNELNR